MKLRPAETLASLPAPMQGAVWMVLSGFFFTGAAASVRYLSADIHFIQISFFRAVFGIFLMLPWLMSVGLVARSMSSGVTQIERPSSASARVATRLLDMPTTSSPASTNVCVCRAGRSQMFVAQEQHLYEEAIDKTSEHPTRDARTTAGRVEHGRRNGVNPHAITS